MFYTVHTLIQASIQHICYVVQIVFLKTLCYFVYLVLYFKNNVYLYDLHVLCCGFFQTILMYPKHFLKRRHVFEQKWTKIWNGEVIAVILYNNIMRKKKNRKRDSQWKYILPIKKYMYKKKLHFYKFHRDVKNTINS
jgi:hypothetical protein